MRIKFCNYWFNNDFKVFTFVEVLYSGFDGTTTNFVDGCYKRYVRFCLMNLEVTIYFSKGKKGEKMKFEYEYVKSKAELEKQIDLCEGRHTQQAVYSTFHSGLTQVCFGCMKVRSTIRRE